MKASLSRMARVAGLLLAGSTFAGCAQLNIGGNGAELPGSVSGWASKDAAPPPAAASAKPKPTVAEAKPAAATADKPARKTAGGPEPQGFKPAAAPETGCAPGESCVAKLKSLMEGPDRSWIRRPETPAQFASGVRLFAYRGLRAKLTCDELALAMADIDSSARSFGGTIAGVKVEQVTRARQLSAQVRDELRAESAQRCAPDAPKSSGGAAQG